MNGSDVSILLQALPYIRHHARATFVIKCGGEIARDPEALEHLATDVALCSHVGIRLLLVHGGGPQATELRSKWRRWSSPDRSTSTCSAHFGARVSGRSA